MSTSLTVAAPAAIVVDAESHAFMPLMRMQQAIERYNAVLEFTRQIMKNGKDYGTVPGVEKPSLLKPGAEKLCSFFGLTPKTQIVKEIELWDGQPDNPEPLFYYWYKVCLYRGDRLIAEGEGSANSRESKYRYRWVSEDRLPAGYSKATTQSRGGIRTVSEYDFSIEKAETTGKYGKPAAYWQAFQDGIKAGTAKRINKPMKQETRPGWEIQFGQTEYRVPNPDVCDQINTIQKIAVKRALIAATLIACNASEYYTQDIEDMDYAEDYEHTQGVPETTASTKATDNGKSKGDPASTAGTTTKNTASGPGPGPDPGPTDTTPDPWAFEMDEFNRQDTNGRLRILNDALADMRDTMGEDIATSRIMPILSAAQVPEWGKFGSLKQGLKVYRGILDAIRTAQEVTGKTQPRQKDDNGEDMP